MYIIHVNHDSVIKQRLFDQRNRCQKAPICQVLCFYTPPPPPPPSKQTCREEKKKTKNDQLNFNHPKKSIYSSESRSLKASSVNWRSCCSMGSAGTSTIPRREINSVTRPKEVFVDRFNLEPESTLAREVQNTRARDSILFWRNQLIC